MPLYSINAHDSEKYRKNFNDIEKTDSSDALVLADFAHVGRTRNLHLSDMLSATSCEVLDHFDSLEQIVNTPIEELSNFIYKAEKNRFKNPSKNAMLLSKAARR